MDALQVRQHNITVEIMTMIVAGMGHDSVGDGALVVARKARPQRGHVCSKGTWDIIPQRAVDGVSERNGRNGSERRCSASPDPTVGTFSPGPGLQPK